MQRRKVDLPEPDGPMMQTVSPRRTSSTIPFSTSSRPNRLWTSVARRTGSSLPPTFMRQLLAHERAMSSAARAEGERRSSRAAGPGLNRRPGLHEPLPEAELVAPLACRQLALDPGLDERPDRCQDQVPDRDRAEVLDGLEVLRVPDLGILEQLVHAD